METEETRKHGIIKTVLLTLLIVIVGIPLFLVILVYASLKFIITAPFERFNYTHSDYFKKYGVKYHYHITQSPECEVFKHTQHNPNVTYNRNEDGYIYLTSKSDLYLLPVIAAAEETDGRLVVTPTDFTADGCSEMIPWDERLADELSHVTASAKDLNVKVLIHATDFKDAETVRALSSQPAVTLYDSYEFFETLGSPSPTAA